MKTISNIISLAMAGALSCVSAPAQDIPKDLAFVRIVNAVAPGEGRVNVQIDGEDIFPKGYTLGQRTGGLGLKAGAHTISIKKTGVESGNTKITLNTGETLTLIGFAEKVPPKKEGDPPVWVGKILRLKQSDPERGFRMTLISLCEEDEVKIQAVVEGRKTPETAYVKRLATTSRRSRPDACRSGWSRWRANVVTNVSTDDPGNYVVVLYQDADGKIKALSFFDPKFVIAG